MSASNKYANAQRNLHLVTFLLQQEGEKMYVRIMMYEAVSDSNFTLMKSEQSVTKALLDKYFSSIPWN